MNSELYYKKKYLKYKQKYIKIKQLDGGGGGYFTKVLTNTCKSVYNSQKISLNRKISKLFSNINLKNMITLFKCENQYDSNQTLIEENLKILSEILNINIDNLREMASTKTICPPAFADDNQPPITTDNIGMSKENLEIIIDIFLRLNDSCEEANIYEEILKEEANISKEILDEETKLDTRDEIIQSDTRVEITQSDETKLIFTYDDILNVIQNTVFPETKTNINVIVPGNAGLPGNNHGNYLVKCLNTIYDQKIDKNEVLNVIKKINDPKFKLPNETNEKIIKDALNNHTLREMDDSIGYFEERILESWLKESNIDDANQLFRNKIGFKWGLYKKENYNTFETCTIQEIDYTMITENQVEKYKLSFLIEDIRLNLEKKKINVNLIYTFAPNYSSTHSGRATQQQTVPNKSEFNRKALRYCILSCLEKCVENSIVIIPHLGNGVHKCMICDNDRKKNREEYIKLVQEIINIEEIKNKKLKIYLVFNTVQSLSSSNPIIS